PHKSPVAVVLRPPSARRPPSTPTWRLFPYTTLFRSIPAVLRVHHAFGHARRARGRVDQEQGVGIGRRQRRMVGHLARAPVTPLRSEEHTSELQSRENLVCRLLPEKKKSASTVMTWAS